jgi:zinc protease
MRSGAVRGVLAALLVALLACASAGAAQQVAPPAVQSTKLKNGLRVLLAPDTLSAAVDVAVWYRAGTRFEPLGMSGITHLMERWAFRGSSRRGPGEHMRMVLAEGGTASTFTTSDASCFYSTMPAEALELALKLEAERMGTVTLTADGLERERRIAREERLQMARTGLLGLGLRRLYATAFPGHPYGWPATGLEQDLDRVTLQACEAYQRAQYAPDNAVLVVVGRFDAAQALSLVRRHFGSLPPPSLPATKPPALAPQIAEQRSSERVEGEVPVLLVGWRAAGGADRSTEALDVLAHLLGAGPRSRLGRELMRAPSRCLGVEGGYDARRDGSLLYVAAVVRPGADSAGVEAALLAESERFATTPPEGAEIDAAKRKAELALMLEWETVRGRGQSLGMAEAAFGDHAIVAERLRRLRELTPDDLARAAAETLKPERRTVVWLVPGGGAPAGARGGGAR